MVALALSAALSLAGTGCGGNTSETDTRASAPAAANARSVWAARTQQLCREKRAAIAGLGYVHITYAGIARAGLPAVRRALDRYLGRLLVVLREFSGRQRGIVTPPALSATMAIANQVDGESQAVTVQLRRGVARARTATELSAAFRAWLVASRRLAVRGDALARQLELPGCRSGAATA